MKTATLHVIENIFDKKKVSSQIEAGKTIEEILKKNITDFNYSDMFVEVYDCETGETTYEPIESDTDTKNVLIVVNGKNQVLDYIIKESDVICITYLPASGWSWEGAFGGMLAGFGLAVSAVLLFGLTGGTGAIVLGVGGILGFALGGLITPLLNNYGNGKDSKNLEKENLPDTRGSQNTNLTNNVFPAVMGKHLVTPFIAGSTYNDIYGKYGEDIYINALYLVGYAPLKLTELKLGEQILAHNQSWANTERNPVFHGTLQGVNTTGDDDTGDITSVWSSNDIKVEILQQGQNGESIDYGSIYPYATLQDDIKANVLHIADKTLETEPLVSYKGVSLANGLRNNPIKFTRQYPLSAKIELNFPNGLYKTYSENSETKYEKIPLWLALQWRVYSKENEVIDGDSSGFLEGEFDSESENYWVTSNKRGWHNFESINGSKERGNYIFECENTGLGERQGTASRGWSMDVTVTNTISVTSDEVVDYDRIVYCKILNSATLKGSKSSESGRGHTSKSAYGSDTFTSVFVIPAGENHASVTGNRSFSTSKIRDIDSYPSASSETTLVEYGIYPSVTALVRSKSQYLIKKDIVISKNYNASENLTISGSKSFSTKEGLLYSYFTNTDRQSDLTAHTGNDFTNNPNVNSKWVNNMLFNLQSLAGTWDDRQGVSEFRVISDIDFKEWTEKNLLTAAEKQLTGDAYEEAVAKKYKDYFLSASNTTKSVEVRVVRISPNYLDETSGSDSKSPATYNDIFTWQTLTTTLVDENVLTKEKRITAKRPLSEEDMRKFCLVAIRAKSDKTDQLSNTLKKFSCMAQGFAPYYDSENKQWFPKKVLPVVKYYKPNIYDDNTHEWSQGEEITEQQFIIDRQSNPPVKSIKKQMGNDFTKNIITKVIRTSENLNESGNYVIPEIMEDSYETEQDSNNNEVKLWNYNANRYLENNVASMILWAGIGNHNGFNALSYDDYDLLSLAKVFEFCKSVKDGSTYNSDGFHYDHEGKEIVHHKGEEVDVYFTANAYIYEAIKFEEMLSSLATAARSVYSRLRSNKLTFIIDKEEPYPVALINQANTLSSSYTLNYTDMPSGLMVPYKDENDGYETNIMYAMDDGETKENHRAPIEQYSLRYITNPYHIWSISRWLLANKKFNKEIVSKKIGMEGYSINLGSVIKLQDDTMLIGTDYGARITKLLEDDNFIYGFITNNTYHFTGELENGLCKQGVVIMQPSEYKDARVITLRLAPLGRTLTIDGESFTVKKGETNVVILDKKISKNGIITSEDCVSYYYNPKIDNVVGFGEIGNETALYRVVGIKPDNKHNFTFQLLKYQPELYRYGKELPTFQNNITPRNEVGDSYNFSNSATPESVAAAVTSSVVQMETQIDEKITLAVEEIKATAMQAYIYADVTSAGFAVGDDNKTTQAQIIRIPCHVIIGNEEREFTFGTITAPTGWTVTTDYHTVVISVPANAEILQGGFNIPIKYREIFEDAVLVDENGDTYVDEEDSEYYTLTMGNELITYNLPFGYVGVKGGNYKGGYNGFVVNNDVKVGFKRDEDVVNAQGEVTGTQTVATLMFADCIIGDYITWTGSTESQTETDNLVQDGLKTSRLYMYCGLNAPYMWKEDTDQTHTMNALTDVFEVLDDELGQNKNNTAEQYLGKLVANDIFVDKLVANDILVQKLVASEAFINKLASSEILFEKYVASISSINPTSGDTMIYMGKNPRNYTAESEFQFTLAKYIGTLGGVDMWTDMFKTKMLASGLLSLMVTGCVQTTDEIYSKTCEYFEETNVKDLLDVENSEQLVAINLSETKPILMTSEARFYTSNNNLDYTINESLRTSIIRDGKTINNFYGNNVFVFGGYDGYNYVITPAGMYKGTKDLNTWTLSYNTTTTFKAIGWSSPKFTLFFDNYTNSTTSLHILNQNGSFTHKSLSIDNHKEFAVNDDYLVWNINSAQLSFMNKNCEISTKANPIVTLGFITNSSNLTFLFEYNNNFYIFDKTTKRLYELNVDLSVARYLLTLPQEFTGDSIDSYMTEKGFYYVTNTTETQSGLYTGKLYKIELGNFQSKEIARIENSLDASKLRYLNGTVYLTGNKGTEYSSQGVMLISSNDIDFKQVKMPVDSLLNFRYVNNCYFLYGIKDGLLTLYISKGREAGSGIIAETFFASDKNYVEFSNGFKVQYGKSASANELITYPVAFKSMPFLISKSAYSFNSHVCFRLSDANTNWLALGV